MVRGKKKVSNSKQNESHIVGTSPTKTKSRRKFKGTLSHSTTVSPNTITKYYSVSSPKSQENSNILVSSLDNVPNPNSNSPILTERRNVLLETNNNLGTNICTSGDIRNNKTESCVPFSPSTALSHLNLNSKKNTKVKKRLCMEKTDDEKVLKTINKHPENGILKNNCHSNVKLENNLQSKLTEFFPVRRSVRKTGKTVLEEKRKTLEEAILSNKEDGLEMRIFEDKGRGVVAARKFKKGEFVVEYAGELISMEEAKKRESIYSQDENTGCYMYYFKHKNNQYCVDATQESRRFGRLLNHSRNGNLSTKTIDVKGIPHLILVAKEDIEPGSELTYDYGDRSKLSLLFHPWLAQ